MQNLLSHEIFKLAKITHVAAFALAAILLACSSPNHLPVDAHLSSSSSVASPSETSGAAPSLLAITKCRR